MQMEKICLTGLLLETSQWVHHYQPESKRDSVQLKQPSSPSTISWEGYAYRVFGFSWNIVSHFQKHGENVNFASYCEILLKLRDAIRRKRSGQLARGGSAS
jgi:hypothetical protein